MEEILKKIDNLIDTISTEDLEKMTSEERREFIDSMEKIGARIDVLKDMEEGGEN